MMLKITERCTMGCTHCMNDAKPDGKDMSLEMLEKCLNFLKKHDVGRFLLLSGGEPLEHHKFDEVMKFIAAWNMKNKHIFIITLTTNGEHIIGHEDEHKGHIKMFKDAGIALFYQISADVRYYPRRIPVHKRIFRENGFTLCDDCIEQMYPQGRAKDNNYEYKSKSSRCFNAIAITKQLSPLESTLHELESVLSYNEKFCTPHISVDGEIKLGESDLCPACATIEDSDVQIISKIKKFRCHECDFINDKLDDTYKKFLEPVE